MTWDPDQYLRFDDLRARPALDLLGRVPPIEPREIWDLGCGTGSITAGLAARWPQARVHGLDSSSEMLQRARTIPGIDWVLGDIATWEPDRPPDLLFSNAALHWLDNHQQRLSRLVRWLAPRGTLAVQMPHNQDQPSHQVLYALARSDQWRDRVAHLIADEQVSPPGQYHEWLSGLAHLDIWETEYQQALTGGDAVVEWTKGSVLRPYIEALGSDGERFVAEYAEELRSHYPVRADGITLFPFRRLFIVAQK